MLNLSAITFPLVIVIVLALAFDFINGFHDTANSIATTVSTRALSPRIAIIFAASLNLVGALVSTNVATTISKGLINQKVGVAEYVIIATLIAAIIWNLITWFIGIPSSSSHALIGALIGASLVDTLSMKTILWNGVFDKVIIPLVASPIIGFAIGFLFMKLLFVVLASLSQYVVNRWFSKLQILSAGLMAFAHGSNDAQKSMGIITLALVSTGVLSASVGIPIEVKIACAIAMAVGTSVGGWKIIKTMGINMIKLQPVGGFAAETASAAVILSASFIAGAPVSTTHIISSAIMGVGASKRLSAVRWSIAKNIVWAWVFTIPVSALIGALITLIIKAFI
jgi:PiT family inorganic phosphate transporter